MKLKSNGVKEDMVFARVEGELKQSVLTCASAEDRTESYIVRLAVIEYLQRRGYLSSDYNARATPPSGKGRS